MTQAMLRKGRLPLTGLILLCLLGNAAYGADKAQAPLKLGFFPIISTVALFKRFSPLRDYLAAKLDRPVALETARDFPTFAQRTAERRYDIVVTAPHFAVVASDSGRYQIRASLRSNVQQLVVVREDSPVQDLSALAGKVVATPPEDALMTMMGHTLMAEAGLSGDSSPIYHPFRSHNAANEAVVGGQAAAAIASSNIIGKALQKGVPLRIIARGLSLPNMATMVATDLPPELADRIEAVLVGMNDDPAGREALKRMRLPGYRSVRAIDYLPARPYAYPDR